MDVSSHDIEAETSEVVVVAVGMAAVVVRVPYAHVLTAVMTSTAELERLGMTSSETYLLVHKNILLVENFVLRRTA